MCITLNQGMVGTDAIVSTGCILGIIWVTPSELEVNHPLRIRPRLCMHLTVPSPIVHPWVLDTSHTPPIYMRSIILVCIMLQVPELINTFATDPLLVLNFLPTKLAPLEMGKSRSFM